MALDTYATCWNKVLLRCPQVSSLLAKDWVNNAYRRLAERRRWSWLLKRGQFLVPALYNTGTVTVTNNSATVTGSGTTFTSAMVGRQFRVGTSPIYTISAFTSTTSITIDQVYGGATTAGATYQIYQCYFTAPSDFHSFVSVWDPAMNWQLWRNVQQEELNTWDAQRTNTGQVYVVASFTYSSDSTPLPRYELWPHQQSQYCYPFLYETRITDLADGTLVTAVPIPRYIRGDVLVEIALAEAARWPGPSIDKPSPYFNLKLAEMHDQRAERMIVELERQDDEVYESDLSYQQSLGYPMATPFGDSGWLQSHAI